MASEYVIARRRFRETTYWDGETFVEFLDEARRYKARAAAKGVLTRLWNAGYGRIYDDFYVVGPDRVPPYL